MKETNTWGEFAITERAYASGLTSRCSSSRA